MKRLLLLSLSLALSAGCSSSPDPSSPGPDQELSEQAAAISIDPYKELMIVHPTVVNDSTRTNNMTGGHWGFRWIMERLSSNSGMAPGVFVEHWLKQFHETTVPGKNLPLRDRQGVDELLSKWKRDASGRLDLRYSPFKLMAVTNRIDKGTSLGDMGEGRFVFALVDPDTLGDPANPQAATPLSMTVIFEFHLPGKPTTPEKDNAQRQRNAKKWHALGSLAFGESYNHELQLITDAFVTTYGPDSLNQLRTNEIALGGPGLIRGEPGSNDTNQIWELREYKIVGGKFAVAPVQATAGDIWVKDPTFGQFLLDNRDAVLAGKVNLGDFAGYTASEDFARTRWEFPTVNGAPYPEDVRSAFAKGTCNGCHNAEQASFAAPQFPEGSQLGFLHISPFHDTTRPSSDPLAGTERVSAFLKNTDIPRRVTFMKGVLDNASSTLGETKFGH